VEYLDEAQRAAVRQIALALLSRAVDSLAALRRAWQESST
jgi:hypothetical protein